MFGKVHPLVGIPVYEVDVLPGLEPGTVPTSTKVLVEFMIWLSILIVGIVFGVELEILLPPSAIWG